MVTTGGLLLENFARLAAVATASTAAMVSVPGERRDLPARNAGVGLSREQMSALLDFERALPPEHDLIVFPDVTADQRFDPIAQAFDNVNVRFLVLKRVVWPGREHAGFLCVLDEQVRDGLTEGQQASLDQLTTVVMADRQREQRHLHLMHVADRALRIDRILRVVSEASSRSDALANLLSALCHFHGAAMGQTWQLTETDKTLIEVSRHDRDAAPGVIGLVERHQADLSKTTMDAILRNQPLALEYSAARSANDPIMEGTERLSGFVCLPMWVDQQRFGFTLAFGSETSGLDAIGSDMASLGDTIRPILLQKVTEERMRHAAYHDDLTQLPNRLSFHEKLRAAIGTARSNGQSFSVLCLDLDGFKRVNDTYGHGFGDSLLRDIAGRMGTLLKEGAMVARMGGDEFAIIHPGGRHPNEAIALANQLLEVVPRPFEQDGRVASVGISVGIAVYPAHGETADLLMRSADQALYGAKQAGRKTWCVYDPAMGAAEEELFLVERDLKDAISRGDFTLAYQPVCDAKSLYIVSFEALLRWRHPILGWIKPDKFIPIAEKSGLIVPLGKWVLETACAEVARWDRPVSISVNLSPLQFRQPDLADQITEVLDRTGLPAERLVLEVTEGLLLDDSDHVLRTMRSLQSRGIRVVLDDFGTAYASLSYLRRFPFNGIKIDRSFVSGLHSDDTTRAIVETILALAGRLDLGVVAEGIENERELNLLRQMGCRMIQGYLVGRPSDNHHAHALLRRSWAADAGVTLIEAGASHGADTPETKRFEEPASASRVHTGELR